MSPRREMTPLLKVTLHYRRGSTLLVYSNFQQVHTFYNLQTTITVCDSLICPIEMLSSFYNHKVIYLTKLTFFLPIYPSWTNEHLWSVFLIVIYTLYLCVYNFSNRFWNCSSVVFFFLFYFIIPKFYKIATISLSIIQKQFW